MSLAIPIVDLGVTGLAGLYEAGQETPATVCDLYLSRVDRFDERVGAWVTVDAVGARAAASASCARWAAGAPLSVIDGCPIGIKANIAVDGLPWHAGIAGYQHRLASRDAACIARLRAAGAVILGLLNMDEGAFGATTDNGWFGRTHNPWRRGHVAGGSSGGSAAAVAAGMCAAALGTDTLGSVRIPAALCGVFGHKPARGDVPTDGVVGLARSLDHVGVLARSADDCAALVAVMADAAARPVAAVGRLAALEPGALAGASTEVADAYERAVSAALSDGLRIDRVGLDVQSKTLGRAAVLVTAAEGQAEHAQALAAAPGGFSKQFRDRLAWAGRQGPDALAEAYAVLAAAAAETRRALTGYDALLTPTTLRASPAFPDPMYDAGVVTALANVTGMPATAFPVGLTADGLPLSVQAMAFEGATSLAVAARLARPLGAPRGLVGAVGD